MDTSKYVTEFKQLEEELASGGLSGQDLAVKAKRHAFLKPIIEKEQEIASAEKAIADDRAMIEAGEDKELVKMAAEELAELEAKLPQLQKELRILVIPPDPNDSKNIYLEIRPGAGGDESALFAAELLRVYQHFAQTKGWATEILEFTPTGLKGCKYVSMFIKGEGAYSWLRNEAGTHRVQRVPDTETAGRVHTSTVTVAIMPEAEEIDIEIRPEDLEMETCRSGGAGGQTPDDPGLGAVGVDHVEPTVPEETFEREVRLDVVDRVDIAHQRRNFDGFELRAVDMGEQFTLPPG